MKNAPSSFLSFVSFVPSFLPIFIILVSPLSLYLSIFVLALGCSYEAAFIMLCSKLQHSKGDGLMTGEEEESCLIRGPDLFLNSLIHSVDFRENKT